MKVKVLDCLDEYVIGEVLNVISDDGNGDGFWLEHERYPKGIFVRKGYCKIVEEDKEEDNLDDAVNQPSHYTQGSIECIDYIEDKNLNFHRGNAVKYITRAGVKDQSREIEDLRKAVWYLNREIERIEK